MRRRREATFLPSNLYILCRLSRKVSRHLSSFGYDMLMLPRVTVATLRNFGMSSCPRCLVRKTDLHQLGMMKDMETRAQKRRIDDKDRRSRIQRARDAVLRGKTAIENCLNEKQLKAESLLPIEVGKQLSSILSFCLNLLS